MGNTLGHCIRVTLFGESHGDAIGCVIDGLPGGILIDERYVASQMEKRKPWGRVSTSRREADAVKFLSGVRNGYSEGSPIAIMIENTNVRREDYAALARKPRPSHADYCAFVKYGGYEDASGGGHFSGRLSAPLVAAGAICLSILAGKGIFIATHIKHLHGVDDRDFGDLATDIAKLNNMAFAVLDENAARQMEKEIQIACDNKDSVGGILETAVAGLEAGVGEPWFDSLESALAKGLFGIGGIKGISFGAGFGFANLYGSQANDPFAARNGKIVTLTNHSGGINGGISNGMPIIIQCAVRPTPSIALPQQTVDLDAMQDTWIEIQGRHDPAIVHRARVVVDSVVAIVLCDLLAQRHGTMWLKGGKPCG